MAQIIWAPSALQDIESIAEYISRDSSDQAALFVYRIIQATDRLEEFPLSGRVVPEIGKASSREVIYGAYRIIYQLEDNEVKITGVLHGSRDWVSKE